MPYQVNKTGYIDYDRFEENAALFRPKLLICGASAYPREWDYARFRKIADKHGAYLVCDMAHISGLVATQECLNPFDYCDVVTSTTHKTLRGPRAGLIFYRRGLKKSSGQSKDEKPEKYDLEDRINFAVFPSTQGGPHENTIAAVAVALKEASTPQFKTYIQDVKRNARLIGEGLLAKGYTLSTGGTDNHLVLWDVRPQGLTGSKLEKLFELVSISVNKNAVYGDVSALSPGAVRIGTPAFTTRGPSEADIQQVVEFLDRGVKIALEIQEKQGKMLKNFILGLEGNQKIEQLRKDVEEFASKFPFPG